MILGSRVRIHPELFPNVHFEYVFLDLAKVWSGCRFCSWVLWNPDSPQIAALNIVLKSSNKRQNQKTTFSVKLTRIPWMFNKIFYFFKKYKWSPLFNLKNYLISPFDLTQSTWPPNYQESPLLVKDDTSLRFEIRNLKLPFTQSFSLIHPKTKKQWRLSTSLVISTSKWRLWRHTFELDMTSSQFLKISQDFYPWYIPTKSFSIMWLESEKTFGKFASLIMFLAKHSPINLLPW